MAILSSVSDLQIIIDYTDSAEVFNFAQQAGSFEVRSLNKTEKVLMQVVPEPPVDTCRPERMTKPVNLIGNYKWYVYHSGKLWAFLFAYKHQNNSFLLQKYEYNDRNLQK